MEEIIIPPEFDNHPIIGPMPDAVAEAIIEAPGIKISIDAGISNGEVYCGGMIDEVLNSIELKWESVIRSA